MPLPSKSEPIVIPTQIICDETSKITTYLIEQYKEMPVMIGETSDMAGSRMTIWSNAQTKTWTIITTKKDITCIIGFGEKLNRFDLGKFSG